jgi:hypothetical protein
MPVPLPRRLSRAFVRELAGASLCGTASALLWLTLGTMWTWAVDVEHGLALLTHFAAAAIVVPAFALAWLLYLARATVLHSRSRWILASAALTLCASLLHRAILFDDAGSRATHGFIDALELSLAIVWRVAAEVDTSFMTSPPVATWSMALGALVAATVLAALSYRPARACVAHGA